MSTHLIILRQNTKIQNTIFIFLNYKMVGKYIFPSYLAWKHLIGCGFKKTVWAPFLKVFVQTFHTIFVFVPYVLFFVEYLQKLKTGNMSGIPRTDVELLQCAPSVDIAMLPDAKDNMIAQDFGE